MPATKTGFDVSQLPAMMASMGLSPEVTQRFMRDPAALQDLVQRMSSPSADASSPRGGRRGDPSHSEMDASQITKMLQDAKAMHIREQALPPSKASEPPKHMLLGQFWGSKEERGSGIGPDSANKDQGFMRQTFVGVDPAYSDRKLEELKRINLSEMLVRKRHKDTFLLCRIISKTGHMVGVNVAVEDPEGGTTKLAIYHYPYTLDASVDDTDVLFPVGRVVAIREPYYKLTMQGEIPMVRVDAPSDIVFVEPDSALLKSVRWETGPSVSDALPQPSTPSRWKDRGAVHFKRQQWFCAAIAYSEGLKLDPKHHLLLLNRSETYLRLGWFNSAAHDAEAVIAMDLGDSILRRKAIFRATKAHYSSGNYQDVLRLSSLLPEDSELKVFSAKATQRLKEGSTGEFDWLAFFKESKGPASRPDVADYQGPVEVKLPQDGQGPRGLFVTRDVKVGELLFVSKPLVSYYPEDNPNKGRETFMAFNFLVNVIGKRSDYALIDRAVQRMWDDPRIALTVKAMHAGTRFPAPAEYPVNRPTNSPLSHPQAPCADIDIARVEGVCSMNVFAIEGLDEVSLNQDPELSTEGQMDVAAGLYELPSFCNHSCLSTAHRVFFGDVMVVRARRSLKSGEEVTLSYTKEAKSLEERSKVIQKKWGFTCNCLLCAADQSEGPEACALRARFSTTLMLRSLGISDAKKHLADVRASYADTSERRLCGVKPELFMAYQTLGHAYGIKAQSTRNLAYCKLNAEAEMDALEAVGLVIVDRNVSGRMKNTPSGLPVDTSKPPCFPHMCTRAVIQMAAALHALGEADRAANWLKVAVWLEDLYVGGGGDLFLERHGPLLTGLRLI